MNNIINMCFSECTGAIFKIAIKMGELPENQKVIVLSDDLSHGPIKDEVDIEERINWWSTVDEDEYFANYGVEDLKENYNTFHDEISRVGNSDILYLWYGSGQEICGMLYALELLKDRKLNVYLINVTDTIVKHKDSVYFVRSAGQINPEDIKKYAEVKQKLDSNKYEELLSAWELLKKDNSVLRVLKNKKIRSEDKNYFDIDILKYTPKEFRKSARIVGSVMGNSEVEISDEYIFWRVKELVKYGKIDYRGKFGIMRKMEIRIAENGLKYLSTDSKAENVWKSNEKPLDMEEYTINQYIEEGRLEEKVNIAKKLKDVLNVKIIAEKTGLTIGQVKNLK
ncbi:DUF1835 domain-containing protein [Clostridium sp. AWRP]|uniref:DUF1835 domain-containing protein n=1 Tax=Clostridium sp. AWRP TaxID=2212991 RepID=UPI000FDC08EB|nr:DUF1835 domain-containing protein [Clostridium sp. AWRP]AZV55775.1 DUF1835 domain-containing protein [Clostridium sp. AWRP]